MRKLFFHCLCACLTVSSLLAQDLTIDFQSGLSQQVKKSIPLSHANEVVVADTDGNFLIWDVGQNKILQRLSLDNTEIFDLAYIKSKRLLAVATPDKVVFYHYSSNKLTVAFSYTCNSPTALSVDDSDIWIACRTQIIRGSVVGKKLVPKEKIPAEAGAAYAIKKRGEHLVVFSNSGQYIYSIPTKELVKEYKQWNTGWYAHYWDEANSRMYLSRENNLLQLNVFPDSIAMTSSQLPVSREENITGLCMTSDRLLYVGTNDGKLFQFAADEKHAFKKTAYRYRFPSGTVTWLQSIQQVLLVGDYYGHTSLFYPLEQKELLSVNENETPALNGVYLSRNNQLVTTHKGASGTVIKVWNIKAASLDYNVLLKTHQVKDVWFHATKDTFYTAHVDGAAYRHYPVKGIYTSVRVIKPVVAGYAPGMNMSLVKEEPMFKVRESREQLQEAIENKGGFQWTDAQQKIAVEYAPSLPAFDCRNVPPYQVVQQYYAASKLAPFIKSWDVLDQDLFFMKACMNSQEAFLDHAKQKGIPENEARHFYSLLKGPKISELRIVTNGKDTLRQPVTNKLEFFGVDPSLSVFYVLYDDSLSVYHLLSGKGQAYPMPALSSFFHVALTPDYLALADDRKVQLFDLDSNLPTSWIGFGQSDYLVHNAEGYFKTKGRSKQISIRKNGRTIPLEAFDLVYNRPDLILKQLNKTPTEEVALYAKAVEKRLARMNGKIPYYSTDLSADTTGLHFPLITHSDTLQLPGINETQAYQVWVNGTKEKNDLAQTKAVILSPGLNKMDWQITNPDGDTIYYAQTAYIYNNKQQGPKEQWYFLGAAIDAYADTAMNLKYARKDIRDLAGYFKGAHNHTTIDTLMGGAVTKDRLLNWKAQVAQASVNDVVIVSLSGHGFLNEKGEFFFGDSTASPTSLERSIPYEYLVNLLDASPARRKMLLIDACHSGLKDDLAAGGALPENIKARGGVVINRPGASQTTVKSFRLMQEEFLDLSRHNGTIVIAAAAGNEFAFESPVQQNGLFTYVFLQGLKEKKADENKDGKVTASELQAYLNAQVEKLSRGAQKPTTRQENLGLDWEIGEAKR
jgi:WD40 repeat protein